jgi:hypothetical protein
LHQSRIQLPYVVMLWFHLQMLVPMLEYLLLGAGSQRNPSFSSNTIPTS